MEITNNQNESISAVQTKKLPAQNVVMQPDVKTHQKELINSDASFAAKAYAAPQVNFGRNVSEVVLQELRSNKSPSQIKLTFNDARTFLEHKLNYTFNGFHGSHAKFSHRGLTRPLIIPVHGARLKPEIIKGLRDSMQQVQFAV